MEAPPSTLPALPTPREITWGVERPRLGLAVLLAFALFLLACVAGVASAALYIALDEPTLPLPLPRHPIPPPWEVLPDGRFLLLVPAHFVAIFVHELGHAVGCWLTGFRVYLFAVAPLRLSRLEGRWRLGFHYKWGEPSGLVMGSSTTPGQRRWATLLMVAAGPVAGLLGAAVAAWGAWRLWPVDGAPSTLAEFLGCVAVVSALTALISLLPMRTSTYCTDGEQIRILLRGGPYLRRELALAVTREAMLAGLRPSECDFGQIGPTIEIRDGSVAEFAAREFAYLGAVDRGDWGEAHSHLDRLLRLSRLMVRPVRRAYALEAAWFEGFLRRDAAAARRWMKRAGRPARLPGFDDLTAEAATLFAEGRPAPAMERLRAARPLVEAISPALRPVNEDRLNAMEARASPAVPTVVGVPDGP